MPIYAFHGAILGVFLLWLRYAVYCYLNSVHNYFIIIIIMKANNEENKLFRRNEIIIL